MARGVLRYRYSGQNWVEVPADSATVRVQERIIPVSTGRATYGIFGQWVTNSFFPDRVQFIGQISSLCPITLFLTPNGQPFRGEQHHWANAIWCASSPNNFVTGRIANEGSWRSIWIGYVNPETTNQRQTKCDILVTVNNQVSVIDGVWGESSCPEMIFTLVGCPPGNIDCGDCCIPCDQLIASLRSLI